MQNWQRMAADRLTQLQDAVNLQAENFCNSIGVLQMYAKESPFAELNSINKQNQQSSQSCNATNNPANSDDNINSSLLDASSTKDHKVSATSSTPSKSCLNGSTSTIIGSSPHHPPGKEILSTKTNSLTSSNEHENSQLFARLIARTAKDIDTLIESLPNTFETESGSSDIHSGSIRQLENDNARCIVELEAVIRRGETLLELIQNALDEIALMQTLDRI